MRIVIVEGYHLLHRHARINISPSLALCRSPSTRLTLTWWIFKLLYHVVRNISSPTATLAPVKTISIFLTIYL